jgi:HSP20 family protein
MFKKRSFMEKLTGSIKLRDNDDYEDDDLDLDDHEDDENEEESRPLTVAGKKGAAAGRKTFGVPASRAKEYSKDYKETKDWHEDGEEETEGQLTVDVYQTPTDIVVQTMVAGVRPEDLTLSITRDMLTIRGRREETKSINDENYFIRELYWGTFARTILLPEEVDIDGAEAMEKHGLLIVKLPKIDKQKQTNLRVKSL